jgi:sugar phosphate isomerase/epimerase
LVLSLFIAFLMNEPPRFSVCELGLPGTSFAEDLSLCIDLRISGLSIDQRKLDGLDYKSVRDELSRHGITAAICAPKTLSVLPGPFIPGTDEDPHRRIQDICESMTTLAALEPATVFIATGPAGGLSPSEARRVVVDGVREAARAAAAAGVLFSIEPMRLAHRETWTIISGFDEAFRLIEETGEDIKLVYDIWHFWDWPDVVPLTKKYGTNIVGVQINDYRDPTRVPADRVLPGAGIADLAALFGALDQSGYDGWYDLEIFSDFALPDSIWSREPRDWVEEGRRGFLEAWVQRR